MKGEAIAELNPTATQVRFKYSLGENVDEGIDKTNSGPLYNTNAQAYCLCLQDCCIKLNWNEQAQNFQTAELIYTKPTTH